jgi:hypothetical protein
MEIGLAHLVTIPARSGIAKASAESRDSTEPYSVRSAAMGLMRVAR